jgi:hypothetical protein
MIAPAPIVNPVVDSASRSTFAWTGWYTQVQGALSAFDQNGNITQDVNIQRAVFFNSPGTINFGSNWQPWTPTVSASGTMTATGLAVTQAESLRIGPLILFTLFVSVTLGGTPGNSVIFDMPTSYALPLCAVDANVNTSDGIWHTAFAFVSAGKITVFQSGQGNYPLGVTSFAISGFYRAS